MGRQRGNPLCWPKRPSARGPRPAMPRADVCPAARIAGRHGRAAAQRIDFSAGTGGAVAPHPARRIAPALPGAGHSGPDRSAQDASPAKEPGQATMARAPRRRGAIRRPRICSPVMALRALRSPPPRRRCSPQPSAWPHRRRPLDPSPLADRAGHQQPVVARHRPPSSPSYLTISLAVRTVGEFTNGILRVTENRVSSRSVLQPWRPSLGYCSTISLPVTDQHVYTRC